MRHFTTRTIAAAVAMLVLLCGCNYSNPHGSQELPPTKRLNSDPSGAKVLVQRLNLELETPCELPDTIEEDDVLMVWKDNYRPWRGTLEDLPQVSLGTYECKLRVPAYRRLNSDPGGATVLIERLDQELLTPCDLPETVEEGDIVMVWKDGYRPWRGELGELPLDPSGTYMCRLNR
jgi:hypothetical protein